MKFINKYFLSYSFIFVAIIFTVFSFSSNVKAAVLPVGTISTCGELAAAGTYTLSGNITNAPSPCFKITSNSVVIDGSASHFTVTGLGSGYAVTATSTTGTWSGYGTTTIQNITFTGFTTGGINANGDNGYPGSGGNVVVSNSTMGTSTANAGGNQFGPDLAGGNIVVGTSSMILGSITSTGAPGGYVIISNSTSTGNITTSGNAAGSCYFSCPGGSVTLLNASVGNINTSGGSVSTAFGTGNGNFNGGLGGSVNLTNSTVGSITASGGNNAISGSAPGNPDGNGGNGGAVSVSASVVAGAVISNGGSGNVKGYPSQAYLIGGTGGTVTISNSSSINGDITSSGGGCSYNGGGKPCYGGPGGSVSITLSTITGSVTANGSSGALVDHSDNPGNGGSVVINLSTVTGTTTASGATGDDTGSLGGAGSTGGSITVATSTVGALVSRGGDGSTSLSNYPVGGGAGGAGGVINITNSTTALSIRSTGGNGGNATNVMFPGFTNGTGGIGGAINVTTSTTTSITSLGGTGGAYGGSGSYAVNGGVGGGGGALTINSSSVGALSSVGSNGGAGYYSGSASGNGGNAGSITVNTSVVNNASVTASFGLTGSAAVGGSSGSNGAGNTIRIATSTTATGYSVNAPGTSGSIIITGTAVDLSDRTYNATSTINISYTSVISTNSLFSAVTTFIINGVTQSGFTGGAFPIAVPGNITTCASGLSQTGTYTLTANIVNCSITGNGILVDGAGAYGITGTLTGGTYGTTTLSRLTVGTMTGSGIIYIATSTSITGSLNLSGTGKLYGDGTGTIASTTIQSSAMFATSSLLNITGTLYNFGKLNPGNVNPSSPPITVNNSSGTIYGDYTFSSSVSNLNAGTITGNATFKRYTSVAGTVNISGSTVFTGIGTVNGLVKDSVGTTVTSWAFSGSSSNTGYAKGNASFTGTSRNSGTVSGNALFYNSSTNSGTVNGTASVYYPVAKPIGNTVIGAISYYNYPGLTYNNIIGDGDWNNSANWVDASGLPVGFAPISSDDVTISGNLTQNTGSAASVKSIVFNGTSVNSIPITSANGATFIDSSVNKNAITGSSTFIGDTASTSNGTVSGVVTRIYNSSAVTTHNFTTEAGKNSWIIEANGSTIDLTGATYSLTNNRFHAFSNSVFIPNSSISSGAAVVPVVAISSPTTGTVSKWTPSISWGNSTVCQYKYGGGSYTPLVCANNGSDLPKPSAGSNTLFIKGTDSLGNLTEKSVAFTYDNTSPVDTDCSTSLDEPTRQYYYFAGNVTGTCTIAADGIVLDGKSFTLTGNISANGAAATRGFNNITIRNITVNGTISANGGIGSTGVTGGAGGTISLDTVSTGVISANGGNSPANGGGGGTITINNSFATAAATAVDANGGNSTSCGYGGSGGTVTMTASSDYVGSVVAGSDYSGSCGGGTPSGSGGSQGTYHPPTTHYTPPAAPVTRTITVRSSGGGGSAYGSLINKIFNFGSSTLTLTPNVIKPLNLPSLPTFNPSIGVGADTGKTNLGNVLDGLQSPGSLKLATSSFSLAPPISSFLFAPLPKAITDALKKAPEMNKYLASVGVSNTQDIVALRNNPILIETPKKGAKVPAGLILVSANGLNVPVSLAYDSKYMLVEQVSVQPGTRLNISLVPLEKGTITATLGANGVKHTFSKGTDSNVTLNLTAPTAPGRYIFNTAGAPLKVAVDVVDPNAKVVTPAPVKIVAPVAVPVKKSGWSFLKFW